MIVRTDLIGILVIVVCSAVAVAAQEIPFTLEKGYVIISGKAGKGQAVQAAVFTGSTFSYLSNHALKSLKLELRSSADFLPGQAKEDAIPLAFVPDVTFADQRPTELRMRPRSFDTMETVLGHKIDMVIGLDYLNERIVQFDFKAHVIRFLDRPPFDYESPAKDSGVRIAMKMQENLRTMLGETVSLPIVEEVRLNEAPFRTIFDTGTAYPVSIAPFAAKKNSIGSVPGKDEAAKVQLKSISLNGYVMADVPAIVKSKWDDAETRYAAIVGLGVMQNFKVTFDWKNKWVALER